MFRIHIGYGETVIQHIYSSPNKGVENVNEYILEWGKLNGLMDNERYNHLLQKLKGQLKYAKEWRDSINNYFYKLSGIKDINQ